MNKIEQELFNRVKTHLLNQGERADSDVQNAGIYECVYHAPSGLKCAVGCLITDEAQHVHDSHEPSEWSESIDKVEMVY